MPDEKISVAQRIRDRLDAGALLRIGPKKMWCGRGKSNTCDGCGEPILTTEVEYELKVDDSVSYRFHMACAGLWQTELKRRGWDKLDDGSSAVGPWRTLIASGLEGIRILLVDDDEDVRAVMEMILESEGALVVSASNADAALALMANWKPDVLVSDIRMPRRDGSWLVNEARNRGHLSGVPTLAVTGFDVKLQQMDVAGFDEYLRKPVDRDQLCTTVLRLARERKARSA
jgi:CheY-like chemotaxis protein